MTTPNRSTTYAQMATDYEWGDGADPVPAVDTLGLDRRAASALTSTRNWTCTAFPAQR